MTTLYPFTDADVDNALAILRDEKKLFENKSSSINGAPSPKILILAGAQGSGKTYLLENELLPTRHYDAYVRLYLPAFRTLHPLYEEMKSESVLDIYQHTEEFIWKLGNKIFEYAQQHKLNIIMETAMDNPGFARVPDALVALGYQFEVHVIACQKEFSHWASLDRVVKSVAKGELERVVTLTQIEEAQVNARAILDAFENACTKKPGSNIMIYVRGIESEMKSRVVCHSMCNDVGELAPQEDYFGKAFFQHPNFNFNISRNAQSTFPCSFIQYSQVVHAGLLGKEHRQTMATGCCKTLGNAQVAEMPTEVFRELCLYVLKYVNP
ncbi:MULTISPECIES: zeta toxin family protein [Pseudomonas]|jgi:predicted ABC-type ATPase|uniref:zeta toxin family protein n=1 Tax=Pseudomonas TaxID=286 RepID=UPI0021F69F74|nr:zeta toxin family protein [Pseudomonas sp. BT-42-2]MCV9921240.1 zeta toxin family protein [Pseudomonas sp. BT-42-2]